MAYGFQFSLDGLRKEIWPAPWLLAALAHVRSVLRAMSLFEYVMIPPAIVLGLAITHILGGAGRIVHRLADTMVRTP